MLRDWIISRKDCVHQYHCYIFIRYELKVISNDMSAEDLLLFMDDIAQIVRDIRNGIKLERTYPPGINNTWNKSKIYKNQ